MLQFKTFRAHETKDQQITDFVNSHIIISQDILPDGTICFSYKDLKDLGITAIDKLERIDKSVTAAQKEMFDAEQGIVEMDATLLILEEKISKSDPNKKEEWDGLQADRKACERQRALHTDTIEGRTKQISDLLVAADALRKEIKQ